MRPTSFKKIPIQQGRITPITGSSTWGEPTTEYITSFEMSVQPFTGDDNVIEDQYRQIVKDMGVIYDVTFDIKFNDRLYYRNQIMKVVYVLYSDMGVIPHLEVFLADCPDELPTWVV